MECGRGPSAFFSRTAKPACFAVPARLRGAKPRAPPVCDGEALSPDGLLLVPRNGRRPLPQTAGEGCFRLLLLSWKKRGWPPVAFHLSPVPDILRTVHRGPRASCRPKRHEKTPLTLLISIPEIRCALRVLLPDSHGDAEDAENSTFFPSSASPRETRSRGQVHKRSAETGSLCVRPILFSLRNRNGRKEGPHNVNGASGVKTPLAPSTS